MFFKLILWCSVVNNIICTLYKWLFQAVYKGFIDVEMLPSTNGMVDTFVRGSYFQAYTTTPIFAHHDGIVKRF